MCHFDRVQHSMSFMDRLYHRNICLCNAVFVLLIKLQPRLPPRHPQGFFMAKKP